MYLHQFGVALIVCAHNLCIINLYNLMQSYAKLGGFNIYPQSMFWPKYKKVTIFYIEILIFIAAKMSVYYMGVFFHKMDTYTTTFSYFLPLLLYSLPSVSTLLVTS